MNIGEILTVTIIDDNNLGNGIAKVGDLPIFIRGALKDDKVKIKINGVYKKYLEAEILEFENKSFLHQKIECPYYEKCGGCDLLHIDYERENKLKEKYISKLFSEFNTSINYFNRFGYRNKITLHVRNNILGLYKKTTNEIVSIARCLLVSNKVKSLIDILKDIDLSSISEIVIREGKGILLSVKGSIKNKDIMKLVSLDYLISIYENDKLIYGEEYLTVPFGKYEFYVNNNSFLQVNTECAIALYEKVKEYVGRSDNLLDLYCGSATIGIYLSDICNDITGVEINKDSVRCGKKNIKENNTTNYDIILGSVDDISGDFDTVIVDPPRAGLSKKLIDYLNNSSSDKLIYVSCNPSTLKRDINLLDNYKIEDISLFNMFPSTEHIESVVYLKRKN